MFPAEILITAVPRLTKVMASDVAIIKIRFLSRPLWALSKRKSTPDRPSCPTRIRPDVTGLLCETFQLIPNTKSGLHSFQNENAIPKQVPRYNLVLHLL